MQKTRKLRFESCEDRCLMAADLTSLGELRIETGRLNDHIEVSIERTIPVVNSSRLGFSGTTTFGSFQVCDGLPEQVVYRNRIGGRVVEERRFNRADVSSIRIYSNEGHDTINNKTDIRSYIYGGLGHDKITGGSNVDYLYGSYGDDLLKGDAGNDHLYGGTGDDELWGNTGNDRLFGQSDDDFLRGGPGSDRLYGSNGNDTLYGQEDNDFLYGGNGDDGLFGGNGTDYLHGSHGQDRFLVMQEPTDMWWSYDVDTIADLHSWDARINFINGEQRQFYFGGGDWVELSAGTFTPTEIELIDIALGDLHRRTGNTLLLKTNSAINNELNLERFGDIVDGNSDPAGINSSGKIILFDASFDIDDGVLYNSEADEDWLMQVLHHEVAHNFDNENDHWNEWQAISGWRSSFFFFWESSADYTTSTDGNWAYLSDSVFAREYGKFNPYEDFATYFAKAMMDHTGRTYLGGNGSNVAKEDFLDDFFRDLYFAD